MKKLQSLFVSLSLIGLTLALNSCLAPAAMVLAPGAVSSIMPSNLLGNKDETQTTQTNQNANQQGLLSQAGTLLQLQDNSTTVAPQQQTEADASDTTSTATQQSTTPEITAPSYSIF